MARPSPEVMYVNNFDERSTLTHDFPHSPLHTTHNGLHTHLCSSGYQADR